MSDPILGTLAYPCESCGAQAGQECLASCPVLAIDTAFTDVQVPEVLVDEVIGTPPLDESLGRLMAAVYRLPFGGLVGARGEGPPERSDFIDADEFIDALADWMTQYQLVCRAEVDALSVRAIRAISLQLERDIASKYLNGTPL